MHPVSLLFVCICNRFDFSLLVARCLNYNALSLLLFGVRLMGQARVADDVDLVDAHVVVRLLRQERLAGDLARAPLHPRVRHLDPLLVRHLRGDGLLHLGHLLLLAKDLVTFPVVARHQLGVVKQTSEVSILRILQDFSDLLVMFLCNSLVRRVMVGRKADTRVSVKLFGAGDCF